MNIKAIKIDPIQQQITEYLWKNTEDFEELYREIGNGCRTIQVVPYDHKNVLLCDEEGRIKRVEGAFVIMESPELPMNLIIAGIAFIVGVGNGDDFGDATVGVDNVGLAWYDKDACAELQLY